MTPYGAFNFFKCYIPDGIYPMTFQTLINCNIQHHTISCSLFHLAFFILLNDTVTPSAYWILSFPQIFGIMLFYTAPASPSTEGSTSKLKRIDFLLYSFGSAQSPITTSRLLNPHDHKPLSLGYHTQPQTITHQSTTPMSQAYILQSRWVITISGSPAHTNYPYIPIYFRHTIHYTEIRNIKPTSLPVFFHGHILLFHSS